MVLSFLAAISLHSLTSPTLADIWMRAKSEGFSGGVIVVAGDKTLLMDTNNVAKTKGFHLGKQTLIPICSVTKAMTAELVLDLAADRKLSLDDPISAHLSWLPAFAGKPTIRQLLTHTSGLANMDNALGVDSNGMSKIYLTGDKGLQSLKTRILKVLGDNPIAVPGANYDYNNTDFLLLEAIVEKVMGDSFESVLRNRILKPAGLKGTRVTEWNESPGKYVNCFETKDGKEFALKPFNLATYGAGGSLLSTQKDLAQWMKFTLKSKVGQRWLSAGSQFGGFQGFGAYALEVSEDSKADAFRPAVERPGAINGYTMQVSFLPKQNIAVAAFTNKVDQKLGSVWEGKGLVPDLLKAALPTALATRRGGFLDFSIHRAQWFKTTP